MSCNRETDFSPVNKFSYTFVIEIDVALLSNLSNFKASSLLVWTLEVMQLLLKPKVKGLNPGRTCFFLVFQVEILVESSILVSRVLVGRLMFCLLSCHPTSFYLRCNQFSQSLKYRS